MNHSIDDIISETDCSSDNRDEEKLTTIASNYCEILKTIGEDPNRPGLVDTPLRAAKAFLTFTEGYTLQVKDVVGDGIFTDNISSEPITVKNIDIFSLCEHHLVPFFGKVHISYIPKDKILGLSKLPRIAEVFARRLQLQERLTQQIAHAVMEIIDAKGVGVVIEASHMCMCMRGVQKVGSTTVTRSMLGVYAENPAIRSEFLSDIRHG